MLNMFKKILISISSQMSITFLRLDMKYMYTSLDINGDGLQLALIDRPEFEIIDVCDW